LPLGAHMSTSCLMSSQNMVLPALEAVADGQYMRVSRTLAAAVAQVPLDSLPYVQSERCRSTKRFLQ
jgi:hypothetical protein